MNIRTLLLTVVSLAAFAAPASASVPDAPETTAINFTLTDRAFNFAHGGVIDPNVLVAKSRA